MTALEMQFAALANVRSVIKTDHREWQSATARALAEAECFGWTHETAAAVSLASKTIPLDSVFERSELPTSAAFWWLDTGIKVRLYSVPIMALMYAPVGTGIVVWLLPKPQDSTLKPVFVGEIMLEDGFTIEQLSARSKVVFPAGYEPSSESTIDVLRFILAACAWLKQRVLTTATGHIERHRRKQISREFDVPEPSSVRVIELRRREVTGGISQGTHDQTDWSCRWIVNGHWRNQPYSNGERKLIYILPYVKGPDDKPLRVPTHTVYQVSR